MEERLEIFFVSNVQQNRWGGLSAVGLTTEENQAISFWHPFGGRQEKLTFHGFLGNEQAAQTQIIDINAMGKIPP